MKNQSVLQLKKTTIAKMNRDKEQVKGPCCSDGRGNTKTICN